MSLNPKLFGLCTQLQFSSQNPANSSIPNTTAINTKFVVRVRIKGLKKCSFSEKTGVLYFPNTHFEIRSFALLLTNLDTKSTIH